MKRYISSADYVNYNANSRGNNVGDCVKRALSMAFDMDYNQTSKELNELSKKYMRPYNVISVFEKFIDNNGGSSRIVPRDNTLTLNETVDSLDPNSTYIYEVSRNPAAPGRGSHLVCSVEGKLFDSWNSGNWYVDCYWQVSRRNKLVISDIKDNIEDLIQYAMECIEFQFKTYIDKLNYQDILKYRLLPSELKGSYAFSIHVKASVYMNSDYDSKPDKSYLMKFAYVFTPAMSAEDAKKKISDVTKVRTYDRFYTIKADIAKLEESQKVLKEAGYTAQSPFYLDSREERFFNTLPGWVSGLVTYLRINEPGQYSDSYELNFLPLPGDPDRRTVELEGYDAGMIREELNRYKKNFARPHIDYYLDEI